MRLGKSFGFAPSFCTVAVSEILENTYISDAAPVFSSKQVAKTFIKDGLIIAFCDNDFHPDEQQWLRSVAQQNGINENWFLCEKEKIERSLKCSTTEFNNRINKYSIDSNLKSNGDYS